MGIAFLYGNGGGDPKKFPTLNASYPADVTINDGITTSATFKVEIALDGKPAQYTYQWYVNGEAVDGATDPSYTLANLIKYDALSIYCRVTNEAGFVQSRTATLAVKHTLLYNAGTRYDTVTGGFKTLGIKRESGSDTTKTAPTVTYNSSNFKITIPSAGSGMVYTANKIDCAKHKNLRIQGILYTHSSSSLYRMFAAAWKSIGTYAIDNRGASWQPTSSTTSQQNISIPVSNIGNDGHHIGFYMENFGSLGSYIQISKMWLEG